MKDKQHFFTCNSLDRNFTVFANTAGYKGTISP